MYDGVLEYKEGVLFWSSQTRHRVTIEKNCFVRAGSVVNKSIDENSIVEGNPAKVIGLMNTRTSKIINNVNKKNIIWTFFI